MPKTLSSETATIETVRSVTSFAVQIPDDGQDPFAVVEFMHIKKVDGEIIAREPQKPVVISKARLIELLAAQGLDFGVIYTKFSTMFHAEKDRLEEAP